MTLRQVLELLYFVTAGPLLTIIVGIGLWQLKIAKDTARLNAKRESYKMAADQCLLYGTTVIPLLDVLDKAIKRNEVELFSKAKTIISGSDIRIQFNAAPTDVAKLSTVIGEFQAALNALDGFSLFFVSGIADEGVAFLSVGPTFCYSVRKLLPMLVLTDQMRDQAKTIIRLFLMWNQRMETQKLKEDKEKIESRLARLDNKVIKPIGTE